VFYASDVATSEFWLTTERLGLQRLTPADLEWLTDLEKDPVVMRHLGGPKPPSHVEEMLRVRVLAYYDAHPGLGVWKTIERSTNLPLGIHILNHIQGESIVQVGFVLCQSAWGRGYATEMGRALVGHAFGTLRLPWIAGIASLDNEASQRALQKIGLRRNGERSFPHPAYAFAGPMAWFELDREAWLAERPAATM
jgi:RimJ/RimL family protein N-acetyltransferase